MCGGLCGRSKLEVPSSVLLDASYAHSFRLFLAVRAAVAPQGHAALGIGAALIPHHKCETNFCPASSLRFVIGTNRCPNGNALARLLARLITRIAVRAQGHAAAVAAAAQSDGVRAPAAVLRFVGR